MYSALAIVVLVLHGLFILWIIFGALFTRHSPLLRLLHVASLIWGIVTELTLLPCPLTLFENWFESKAGVEPYNGGFLLHYLDKVVYPDVSPILLTIVGVFVCVANLAIYVWLFVAARKTSYSSK